MDIIAIREEREVLDHQKCRIEEILSHRIVSPEMARDLRRRLDYIGQRLIDLSMPPVEMTQPAAFN